MPAVYSRKSIGPRTDPCGTPHKTAVVSERDMPRRASDLHQILHVDVEISVKLNFFDKYCEIMKIQDGGRPPL